MRFLIKRWQKMTTGCLASFPRGSNGLCLRERLHPSSAILYTSPALESTSLIRHFWMNMELIRRLRTILCVEIAAPNLQSEHLQLIRKQEPRLGLKSAQSRDPNAGLMTMIGHLEMSFRHDIIISPPIMQKRSGNLQEGGFWT